MVFLNIHGLLFLSNILGIILNYVLCQGATIVDLSVNVALDSDYQLPPAALAERSVRMLY